MKKFVIIQTDKPPVFYDCFDEALVFLNTLTGDKMLFVVEEGPSIEERTQSNVTWLDEHKSKRVLY